MMTKKFYFLTTLLLTVAGALSVTAETVTIPTAEGTFIDWNKCDLTAATIENNGANIGSKGKNTVATFTIENATQQDYVLTFATGSKNEAKLKVTVTNGDDVVLDKDVMVVNTGNWTPSTASNFLLSQLPAGTYELKFQVTEASSTP